MIADWSRVTKYSAVFYAANGFGPFVCEGCREEVRAPWHATDGDDHLVVHHVDHNDRNHDPKNLVAMHSRCHSRHHAPQHVGRPAWLTVENEKRDKTPVMCHCGAGPFRGASYLKTHQSRASCFSRAPRTCEECDATFKPNAREQRVCGRSCAATIASRKNAERSAHT